MNKQLKSTTTTNNNPTPATNTMNPWTNKYRQRGEGLLNSIISKHLNEEQQYNIQTSKQYNIENQLEQQQCINLAKKIQQRDKVKNNIDDNIKQILDIKKRSQRIDEILAWVQKIQQRGIKSNKNQLQSTNKLAPIDSSFIYLPAHSGTILHQILQDCVLNSMGKQRVIGQQHNLKLKQLIQNIKNMNDMCKQLQQAIL